MYITNNDTIHNNINFADLMIMENTLLTKEEIKKYKSQVISNGITTQELQTKSLEILKYFIKLCNENNLRYWCGGGTCIGAIRHKGFIPWDDDIDVFMPRPDYEKLYEIWNNIADTKNYALARTTENINIHQADMQLVDLNTTFINKHSVNEDILHGISIDIMPFEGCPKSKFLRAVQIYHSIMYCIFNVQRLPDNQGALIRKITSVIYKIIKNPKTRYKIWKSHEKQMSKYNFDTSPLVKETITSFRALFFPYPRSYFNTTEVDFEDIKINIPKNYNEYLTRIFGNYMSLPSENGRCAKHNVEYMNITEPFTKFKGIYYCKKKQESI